MRTNLSAARKRWLGLDLAVPPRQSRVVGRGCSPAGRFGAGALARSLAAISRRQT